MTTEDSATTARLLKPVRLGPLPPRPFVSVLIAHYNYEDYIGRAIESVLGQTYRDFELVICDDGSTDNSPLIIESYAKRDSRIQFVRQVNAGVGSSTNTAYSLSRGEIVCFLDADDRYLPDKLQAVVEAFRSHPESGFLVHRVFLIDIDGSRMGLSPLTLLLPNGWYGPFVLRNGGLPAGVPPTSTGRCLRREICELIFPVPVELTRYADAVIAEQAGLRTSVISLSPPLAEYRIHGSNLAATSGVTLEYVDRELRIQKENWAINKKYLTKIDPALASAFAPFERYPMSLMLTYIGAKLGEETNRAAEAYRRFVEGEGFTAMSKISQWFWRLSILLPRQLFVTALGFVWGGNSLKRLIARVCQSN